MGKGGYMALILFIGVLWIGYALAGGLGILLAIIILILASR